METSLRILAIAAVVAIVVQIVIAITLAVAALQMERIARACEEDAGLGGDDLDEKPEAVEAKAAPVRRGMQIGIQKRGE